MSSMARITEIAERFGVQIRTWLTTAPPAAAFSWSFGPRDGFMFVGPDVVYLVAGIRFPTETAPWVFLLHEVAHAHCKTDNEDVVSGWAQCVAEQELDNEAQIDVADYDDASGISPSTARNAAYAAGWISENYEPL